MTANDPSGQSESNFEVPTKKNFSDEGPVNDFGMIPGYIIHRIISQDSRAWTYEGIHRDDLSRTTPIIVSRRNDPESVTYFQRIATVLVQLDHRGIPKCQYDTTVDGFPYLILAWTITNSCRDQVVANGPLSPEKMLHIIREVAAALEHAHERQIVHGHLRPEHVGTTSAGHLGVWGFGEFSPTDELVGNVLHLAPEQASDPSNTSVLSDVYALGALAYYLLTGEPAHPLSANASNEAYRGLASRLATHRPEVPPAMGLVIERAMQSVPRARFPSVVHFVESCVVALQSCVDPVIDALHETTQTADDNMVGDVQRKFDHLLSTFVDPYLDDATFSQLFAELQAFGGSGLRTAPVLLALPRLIEETFGKYNGESGERFLKELFPDSGSYARPLHPPILETLREVQYDYLDRLDPIDLKHFLQMIIYFGGYDDVRKQLIDDRESIRTASAYAILESILIELRKAREEHGEARELAIKLQSQRLADLLEQAAVDDACQTGIIEVQSWDWDDIEQLVDVVGQQSLGGACSEQARVLAARTIRSAVNRVAYPHGNPYQYFRSKLQRLLLDEPLPSVRTAITDTIDSLRKKESQ